MVIDADVDTTGAAANVVFARGDRLRCAEA
jgi:hypothetical protein